jgi:hypothetical protein
MATKIKKIEIQNFKAIGALEVDFNGCTAIVLGKNNSGKTSFLRGIPDRIRGEKPELILKHGQQNGSGALTLTSGEMFLWDFDNKGKDKLTFVTKEGYKTSVSKEISKRFFPPIFDIDKFLNSPPKEQSKILQKLVGIDFTEIDLRYKEAYDDRTEKNKLSEKFHAKLLEMLEAPYAEEVELTELQNKKEQERTRLNELYMKNKAHNDSLRNKWLDDKSRIDSDVSGFNNVQYEKQRIIEKMVGYQGRIKNLLAENENLPGLVDLTMLENYIKNLPQMETIKKASELYPKEPEYINELPEDSQLKTIDQKILDASNINQKAAEYKNYIRYKKQVEDSKQDAFDADVKVKGIEQEREALIKSAKLPAGISFSDTGITVDGLPLDKNQISTSKLYCAALRLASLNLGEVKALHFDASPLDKNSLSEIEEWAKENNCQLLIERPDFDGGEIKYELIEEN